MYGLGVYLGDPKAVVVFNTGFCGLVEVSVFNDGIVGVQVKEAASVLTPNTLGERILLIYFLDIQTCRNLTVETLSSLL